MLKNEAQYQMYLDVLDILEKNKYTLISEKDGMSTKITAVYADGKPCGKVLVVAKPPGNKESGMYAMSAHSKLVAQKEEKRAEYPGLVEGAHIGNDTCLWYYGFSAPEWVKFVDDKFPEWHGNSQKYLKNVAEMAKLSKSKPVSDKEFAELEGEFNELAAGFTAISFYRDSPELAGECKKYVPVLKEAFYQKSSKSLEKLKKAKPPSTSDEFAKTIANYEELLERFTSIKDFDNSADKISFIETEIAKFQARHEVAAYQEAAKDLLALEEREDRENLFEYIHRARRYKKIAKKFTEVIPYDNSKERAKKCRKNYKIYRRKIIKKVFPIALIVALVIVAVIVFVLLTSGNSRYLGY